MMGSVALSQSTRAAAIVAGQRFALGSMKPPAPPPSFAPMMSNAPICTSFAASAVDASGSTGGDGLESASGEGSSTLSASTATPNSILGRYRRRRRRF